MGFEKAKLLVEKGGTIQVLFNPSEYSLERNVNYAEKQVMGLNAPILQFASGNSEKLSMSLFFDTYQPPTIKNPKENGTDVRKLTKQIMELTQVKASLHRPPKVTFKWGTLNFQGVLESVSQKFTMFLASGIPVRARLEVQFKEMVDIETLMKGTPLESPDRTKYCVVHEGEQLYQFAYEEYGSVSKWREIAKANGIMNPLDLKAGQTIKLPALDDEA